MLTSYEFEHLKQENKLTQIIDTKIRLEKPGFTFHMQRKLGIDDAI